MLIQLRGNLFEFRIDRYGAVVPLQCFGVLVDDATLIRDGSIISREDLLQLFQRSSALLQGTFSLPQLL